ncbi:MAG: hypothetical protein B6D55_04680 [Candidatus Omnitrophica bacterium 4484_70.2]|nr:MAG: hypothetical protein B6D55_04680 [Candidatus Omnitrophica bacterium 4484_70.2]
MDKLVKDRATAWVRLLANAKREPVVICYCGKSKEGQWLWEVRQGDKYLALQGTELQVIESLKNC